MTPYKPRQHDTVHAVTVDLIEQCGGVDAVSKICDVAPSTPRAWSDPHKTPLGIPAERIVQLMQACPDAVAFAEFFATLAGGFFVPGTQREDCIREMTADLAASHGEVFSKVLRSLAPQSDGGCTVTPAEAIAVLPKIDEQQRLLGRVRSVMTGIARSGLI